MDHQEENHFAKKETLQENPPMQGQHIFRRQAAVQRGQPQKRISNSIIIKNIDWQIYTDSIMTTLQQIGNKDLTNLDQQFLKSKSILLAKYESEESASQAINYFNGKEFNGKILQVDYIQKDQIVKNKASVNRFTKHSTQLNEIREQDDGESDQEQDTQIKQTHQFNIMPRNQMSPITHQQLPPQHQQQNVYMNQTHVYYSNPQFQNTSGYYYPQHQQNISYGVAQQLQSQQLNCSQVFPPNGSNNKNQSSNWENTTSPQPKYENGFPTALSCPQEYGRRSMPNQTASNNFQEGGVEVEYEGSLPYMQQPVLHKQPYSASEPQYQSEEASIQQLTEDFSTQMQLQPPQLMLNSSAGSSGQLSGGANIPFLPQNLNKNYPQFSTEVDENYNKQFNPTLGPIMSQKTLHTNNSTISDSQGLQRNHTVIFQSPQQLSSQQQYSHHSPQYSGLTPKNLSNSFNHAGNHSNSQLSNPLPISNQYQGSSDGNYQPQPSYQLPSYASWSNLLYDHQRAHSASFYTIRPYQTLSHSNSLNSSLGELSQSFVLGGNSMPQGLKGKKNTKKGFFGSHKNLRPRYKDHTGGNEDFMIPRDFRSIIYMEDKRTTVYLQNIPNKYNQINLLQEIEHHNKRFDFLYLPMDFKSQANVGYAFLNFLSPLFILDFCNEFQQRKWNRYNSPKLSDVKYARIQSIEGLMHHFKKSNVVQQNDELLKPKIFQQYEEDVLQEIRMVMDKYNIGGDPRDYLDLSRCKFKGKRSSSSNKAKIDAQLNQQTQNS